LDAMKGRYDALLEERQALERTQQELQNKRQAIERQLRDSTRRATASTGSAEDAVDVAGGSLTQAAALERAAERAQAEYVAGAQIRGEGVESREAYNAYRQARAAADAARVQEEKNKRGQGYEREGLLDERAVQQGKMSAFEAAQAEVARAKRELDILKKQGRSLLEIGAAENRVISAENQLAPMRAAAERDRVNGVLPQISSSSLAQLGGGGNVNVFGGRPGEGLSEQRETNRILRAIEAKLGATRSNDVGF
jgi:hypothetical protein